METENKFLPLGSIVVLARTTQKLIIIARGMLVKDEYYDYGAFLYPQGLIEDSLVYFNQDQIAKIEFQGFSDEDDELFISYIEQAIEQRGKEQAKIVEEAKGEVEILEVADEEDIFASIRDLEN